MDLWPPSLEPMAQGLPGSSGVEVDTVVAAFAKGGADGVDGRQVEHVEAHGGDVGQEGFDVGEGAVTSGVGGGGSREELVPGGVAGSFAVDPEMQLLLVTGGEGEIGILGGEGDDFVAQRELVGCGVVRRPGGLDWPRLRRGGCCRRPWRVARPGSAAARRNGEARGMSCDSLEALGLSGDWLRGEALSQIGAPGVEVIDPSLDGVEPVAEFVHGEGGGPAGRW